ncbi:MAG TPA: LysR family transcriptional regulator [Kofleriaceae bacterium]
MLPFAWDDIRCFLTIARAGSLAAAARTLAIDQTTAGRRLAALEDAIGQRLFERTPRGLAPTPAGLRTLAAAEAMADAAGDFEVAAKSDARATELVRIATTDTLAEQFLIPAIARLRERAPNVEVAILTGWACVNLLRGEADIAVRIVKPVHPRLVARKVADFALRAYASRAYIAAHGAPAADLRGHDVIAYADALAAQSQLTVAGLDASEARIVLRANTATAIARAGREGIGIAELPSFVGDADRALVRVCGQHERRYGVYVVVHEQRRRALRTLLDAIGAAFRHAS